MSSFYGDLPFYLMIHKQHNLFISKSIKSFMKKDETYLSDKVTYIKKNLQKGYNKDSLKWALISQGNSRQEVDKAFTHDKEERERLGCE